MAERGRQPGFYVYRIFSGAVTVYVGKGSGRRLMNQKRRFGCDGEIIEECRSEDHAFARERHWMAKLMPTDNNAPGGAGGRVRPKRKPRLHPMFNQIEQVGSRRFAARMLVAKIDERNCAALGVSLDRLQMLRSVANGERC